jgi:hypothetical protein
MYMSVRPNPFARRHAVEDVKRYLENMLEAHQDNPNHRNRRDVPGAGPAGSLGVGMGPPESKESAMRRVEMVNRLKRHWANYVKANASTGKWTGNRPDSASEFTEAYDAFRDLVWYFRGLSGRSRDYY